MRAIIIFYLLLSFVFTFVQAITGMPIGADFDDLEEIRTNTTGQAVSAANTELTEGTTEVGTGWLGNIVGLTATFFKNILVMSTFQFRLNGAPEAVNLFVSGILGIISLIWWSYVIKEVAPMVPGL